MDDFQTEEPEENKISEIPPKKNAFFRFFTYERILLIMTVFFAVSFIGSVIIGATNGLHRRYTDAQANLVVSQNFRIVFILLIPYVFEKLFGLRIDLKLLTAFYLFGFLSTVIGETFLVYYKVQLFDKILHATSGIIAIYFSYGFVYVFLKNGTGKHNFAAALVLGFLIALGLAAFWEIIEFTWDLIFGTNMQKIIPENELFNGGDSFAQLNGTDAQIAEFFREPSGYKYALLDSMWDMVVAFVTSAAFAVVMIVIKLLKKNSFENCVIYDPDLRMKLIKNRKNKAASNG